MKFAKLLCIALCLCMLVAAFASCTPGSGDGKETTAKGDESTTEAVGSGENESSTQGGETLSAFDKALEEIKNSDIDFSSHNEFNILTLPRVVNEYKRDEHSDEPLEQAVYNRNQEFEVLFPNVDLVVTASGDTDLIDILKTDINSDGKYDIVFNNTDNVMSMAQAEQSRDFLAFDALNLEEAWWDQGTRGFVVSDRVWFMNGSFNTDDDNCTYVLMFNKDMYNDRKNSYEKSFYESVQDKEWTLDYFQTVTQGVSSDNGDGIFDEKDTYGFVTTWEYGTTFFYASGMHYVTIEEGKDPVVDFNTDAMAKASDVLDKVLAIYYTNNATYWPAGGSESLGLDAFKQNRAMFYGEVVSYIITISKEMQNFGVLPIPMYDQEQDNYHSWSHGIGCTMVISRGVLPDEFDAVGTLIEGFNLLSEQYVKPAYYDVVLKRKTVSDPESRPMLDLIFKGKVYDLAMYNGNWGLVNAFKTCVNNNENKLASNMAAAKGTADRGIRSLLRALGRIDD